MIESTIPSTEDNGKHLWSSILSEVRANSSLKLPSRKAIVLLGDSETGKTTLVARLQGTEDPKKSSGLEYMFIDVKDEDRDDHTKLSVWLLDGDPYHASLLKFALTDSNLADCMVVIVASMAEPWALLESLEQWTAVLEKHIARLKVPPEDLQEYKESLTRHFQDYTEPDELQNAGVTGLAPGRRQTNPLHPPAQAQEPGCADRVVLPLSEETLSSNLGIPIIVVITKTDSISMLEKEYDYREEHLDYIQHHIRKFCLRYGAALFYTSVKEDKNCDLLNRYIQHRIYGFPFLQTAYVVEKDSIFVPTGWDNEKKMAILLENMTSIRPDDPYEDVITRPVVRKAVPREPDIVAEEEQAFLNRIAQSISRQPGSGSPALPAAAGTGTGGVGDSPRGSSARQDSPHRSGGTPGTGGSPRTPSSASSAALRGKTGAGMAPGGTPNEGVLATFFNNLLNKKTGASPGGIGPGVGGPTEANGADRDKAALTRDAQAELEKMVQSKPLQPPAQSATAAANSSDGSDISST